MARIMLTIPDELLAEVDEAAQNAHRSRSEYLREAARTYLAEAYQYPQPSEQQTGKVLREAVALYGAKPQIEEATTMAFQFTEQIEAIEKLLQKVQGALSKTKPQDLFGTWKESVPKEIDIDTILADIRGSWQSEMKDLAQ